MREFKFIIGTMIIVWLVVYFAIPGLGYTPQTWEIITCAFISAFISGIPVLLRQTVVEDIMIVAIFVILSSTLGLSLLKIEFLFAGAIIAGLIGIAASQVNQFIADKASGQKP